MENIREGRGWVISRGDLGSEARREPGGLGFRESGGGKISQEEGVVRDSEAWERTGPDGLPEKGQCPLSALSELMRTPVK